MKASKILASLLAVGMTGAMLTGCTNQNPASSGKEPESSDGGKKASAITLMASQNWIKDIDRELFKKYQDKTGTEIKLLVTPDNGYDTLLGTSLSGGSNAVDIFMFHGGSPAESAGIVDIALDLTNEPWAANLEDWAKQANTHDGKLVGFSTWGVDYEGILYNKSYFKENNLTVPETWDDFIALCDKISSLGKTPLYEGINGNWHTQTWLYSMTPTVLKEDADFVANLNNPKGKKFADYPSVKKGLEQINQLLSNKKYYTNDGQAEDWFGSYTSLANRDTVMMATYSAYVAELKDKGNNDEWGMFPIPLCDNKMVISNGGGVSKYINKNSQYVDTCKDFLSFLAESENLESYYAARSDLVSSAFKGVKAVNPTSATTEALERSDGTPPIMMMKDVLYWDPNMYTYFQGFANQSVTVDKFIQNMDAHRAEMFDTAASAE